MVNGFGRTLLVLSAAAFLSAGSAYAQRDAKQLFEEGVHLLRINQDTEALEKFKEAVAADPTMEQAYLIWKETDQRVWSAMLVKSGDFSKIARHFLRLAQLERKRFASDADKIQALVEKSLSDSYEDRTAANLALMSDHGDYAVSYLLDALGNPDEDKKQTYAILACDQIGRSATLPLVAALESENALLRRNVSAALYYIGDERALPALKALAERDEDASVREAAQRAVRKIGGDNVGSAIELYLKHSHEYLVGNPYRLRDSDLLDGVWSFANGKLVHRPVPAIVFPLELAKDAAYGALGLDPNSGAALVSLTRAYVAEKAVVEAALAGGGDTESLQPLTSSLGEIGITVLAAGPKVVGEAYAQNLAEGMIPAAVEALHTLARLEDPANLKDSPLLASLSNPDKRIRYGAAVALSGIDARLDEAQRSAVVAALGQAVLEQSVVVVKAIDPTVANEKVYAEAASSAKGIAVEANANTTKVLADIAKFPPDVLVVHETLDTLLVDDVIAWCKDRPALQNTKIVLVSKDPKGAQDVYGDKIQGYIEAPITAVALQNRVEEVMKGAPMDDKRLAADRMAGAAAEAMAKLDPATYPVANAAVQLVEAAARTNDSVAVPALQALGHAGRADDLGGLVAVMNGAKDRTAVCAAAAGACGRIMARTGNADKDTVDALIALATEKSLDASIRVAAVAALGQAPILPGTRAKLMRTLRVDPTSAEAAGGAEGN